MIGTLTWHFHNCVVICNEEDTCAHAMYREYENLEIMLNDIKRLQHRRLQHRPFVEPEYILVEYQGFCYYLPDREQRIQITQLVSKRPSVKEVVE